MTAIPRSDRAIVNKLLPPRPRVRYENWDSGMADIIRNSPQLRALASRGSTDLSHQFIFDPNFKPLFTGKSAIHNLGGPRSHGTARAQSDFFKRMLKHQKMKNPITKEPLFTQEAIKVLKLYQRAAKNEVSFDPVLLSLDFEKAFEMATDKFKYESAGIQAALEIMPANEVVHRFAKLHKEPRILKIYLDQVFDEPEVFKLLANEVGPAKTFALYTGERGKDVAFKLALEAYGERGALKLAVDQLGVMEAFKQALKLEFETMNALVSKPSPA